MTSPINKFWTWYEKNYKLNLAIAAGLFFWQLIHLYWLTTNVVIPEIWGISFTNFNGFWEYIIIFVDYTEIPALITTSILYVSLLRKKFEFKNLLLLFFVNTQWLHLFWITDEFVIEQFATRGGTVLPIWLAWVAIFIDYLELPVIVDTVKKFFKSFTDK